MFVQVLLCVCVLKAPSMHNNEGGARSLTRQRSEVIQHSLLNTLLLCCACVAVLLLFHSLAWNLVVSAGVQQRQ